MFITTMAWPSCPGPQLNQPLILTPHRRPLLPLRLSTQEANKMAAELSAFPALKPAIITKVQIDPSGIHPFGI